MGGQVPQSRGRRPPGCSPPSQPERANSLASAWASFRDQLLAFSLIFTCLFVSHVTLLRLPYFWDEAGYYVPAARDLLHGGARHGVPVECST